MVLRIWKIVSIPALFALTACVESTKEVATLSIPFSFEEGDIVTRRGRGLISNMVLFADKKGEYSHIGLIIKKEEHLFVIHSVPDEDGVDGIKCDSLTYFFNPDKALAGAAFRIELKQAEKQKLTEYALQKLKEELPFDHHYNLNNDQAQYCTEFVWNAFLQIGIDLTDSRRTSLTLIPSIEKYLVPSDLYTNKRLHKIFEWSNPD
ncbi:MAG: YiiX/YebB-like N1pC/P60 family cysteine hydrolase [Phocaeicola sp.]